MTNQTDRCRLTAIAAAVCAVACASDPPAVADAGSTTVGTGAGREFAGALTRSNTFLAVVGNDTRVNAYACDGQGSTLTVAEWLSGNVANGTFTATSARGSTLTGAYGNGRVTGSLALLGGAAEAFDVPASPGAAGLYRGSVDHGGRTYEAGVIFIADGSQRGAIGGRPIGMVMAEPMIMPSPMIMPDPMGLVTSIGGASVTIPLRPVLNAFAR